MDCVRQTYRTDGLKGFYRGQTATLLREVPGGACYFAGVRAWLAVMPFSRSLIRRILVSCPSRIFSSAPPQYEIFCRALTPEGSTRADLSPWRLMLAGSLGGIAYWASFFPGAPPHEYCLT